jgi:hypothetical protein
MKTPYRQKYGAFNVNSNPSNYFPEVGASSSLRIVNFVQQREAKALDIRRAENQEMGEALRRKREADAALEETRQRVLHLGEHSTTALVIPLPGAALQPVQQVRRVGRFPSIVSQIRDARDKRNHQIRQDIEAVRAVMRTSNDAHCKVFSTGMARLKELGAPPQAFLIYSEF